MAPVAIFRGGGIIPPNEAFASAEAIASSKVVEIDCVELRKMFEADPKFAYHMTARAAHVIRERLRDLSIETLAFIA